MCTYIFRFFYEKFTKSKHSRLWKNNNNNNKINKKIKNETPKWEIFANNSYPQKPQYKFNSL